MLCCHASLVFGLFATAFAAPSPHHSGNRSGHRFDHASGHVSVSGGPYPIGNATNTMLLSGSSLRTIHLTRTSTIDVTVAPSSSSTVGASQDASSSSTVGASQDADDKIAKAQTADGITDVEKLEAASAASDGCQVQTVTYNPTTTVTVTATSSGVAAPESTAAVEDIPLTTTSAEAVSVSLPSSSEIPGSSSIEQPPTQVVASVSVASSSAASSLAQAITTPSMEAVASAYGSASQAASESAAPSALLATSSSSVPASASNANFRTKRGIIASGNDQLALVSALTPYTKISWLGDWYSGPPTNLPPSMQFVPQNYGKQSDVKGEWTSNAKKAVLAGDKYFLSFGEPGTPNAQLYMDPQDAVTLFMEKMQPYAEQGVIIGAPGTLQNDQDFTWLTSFLDGCEKAGCSIGFLAFHWFWLATEATNFKDRLNKFTTLAKGKPIWVDNFQASGTAAAQKEFLQEIVPFLESQTSVQRYGYVPVDPGNGEGFLNDDGKTLSDLGSYYANL